VATSLRYYEIYVRTDNAFSDTDTGVRIDAVSGDPARAVTSYDLRNAYATLGLSRGVTYYAAVRALTRDTPPAYSGFSPPSGAFSFP
jgi:hypothetical protein